MESTKNQNKEGSQGIPIFAHMKVNGSRTQTGTLVHSNRCANRGRTKIMQKPNLFVPNGIHITRESTRELTRELEAYIPQGQSDMLHASDDGRTAIGSMYQVPTSSV